MSTHCLMITGGGVADRRIRWCCSVCRSGGARRAGRAGRCAASGAAPRLCSSASTSLRTSVVWRMRASPRSYSTTWIFSICAAMLRQLSPAGISTIRSSSRASTEIVTWAWIRVHVYSRCATIDVCRRCFWHRPGSFLAAARGHPIPSPTEAGTPAPAAMQTRMPTRASSTCSSWSTTRARWRRSRPP